MKKLSLALVIATLSMSLTVYGGDAELLSRIKALEERVARLEVLVSGPESKTTTAQSEAEDAITLNPGTWIVGEDIPAGRYNLTSSSDGGAMCYVYESLDDKLSGELWDDFYSLSTEAYLEQYKDMFDSSILDSLVTEVFNVYMLDGQCIEIEGSAMVFTPS